MGCWQENWDYRSFLRLPVAPGRDNSVHTFSKEDVLPAGAGPKAILETKFRLSEAAGKILFGKFTYAILFDKDEHFSTFKLKVGADGIQSDGLPGSYSDWA